MKELARFIQRSWRNDSPKDIAEILLFGILSAVTIMFLVVVAANEQPKDHWAKQLTEFDKKCHNYLHSDTTVPQIVLVGPSFVHQLGPVEGAFNLGLLQMRPQEVERFISTTCRDGDIIFLGVTIRDIILANEPIRHAVVNPLARKMFLAKTQITPATYKQKNRRVPAASQHEVSVLAQSLDPSLFSSVNTDHMVSQVKKCAQLQINADDLAPYAKLYEQHPSVQFVLFPTIPLQPVDDSSDFGIAVNTASTNIRHLAALFKASELPVVELPLLPPSTYKDLCHYTPEGKAIIRGSLSGLFNQSRSRLAAVSN
jgi:hypothetical protein